MDAPPVPAAVARAAEIMAGFPGDWSLCGGWAVDAWVGQQTREHKDVDIVVFQDGLDALLSHFAGWELLAHDQIDPDSITQWEGRPLTLPAHVHARVDGANLDFQVSRRETNNLVLSSNPRIELELQQAIGMSSYGLPTLAPEALLYYKALERRPQDDADFAVLEPRLSAGQTSWLQDALARTHGA